MIAMFVLGIETTCDETACAIVQDGKEILSNEIASQAELHLRFGGVFPELASRQHMEMLLPTLQEALRKADLPLSKIELIAAAKGPGLIGPLLIGLNAAKALSMALKIPFVGVNHVEAHLYAAMMEKLPPFPALGVVVSGGHTFLVKIFDVGSYSLIGTTIDDAIGEAFDKVAALLKLPYPGGPAIEQLAKEGDPSRFSFKKGVVKGRPWDFSFSGLKTHVLYTIKGANASKSSPLLISEKEKADAAAAFQKTALGDIIHKSIEAAHAFSCQSIVLGGGVTCNMHLRNELAKKAETLPLFWPPKNLCLDNAAMIAGLGYHAFQRKGGDTLSLEPQTRMKNYFSC